MLWILDAVISAGLVPAEGRLKMASNKTGIDNITVKSDLGLGRALLAIVAAGVAGGAALIGASKAVGELLLDKQAADSKKLEEQREADKEAVRRIMENDMSE